jgi:hypothetical protein
LLFKDKEEEEEEEGWLMWLVVEAEGLCVRLSGQFKTRERRK